MSRQDLGLPPGTPVFVGDKQVEEMEITYFRYNEKDIEENRIVDIETDLPLPDKNNILWINVVGIHDVDTIRRLGSLLDIDPILLEDIVNTSSRPKIEDLGDYFFLIVKELEFKSSEIQLEIEHMTFIVGENYVVTFQERSGDNFDTIRERIRKNKGPIRKSTADYLFNRLLDMIVDNYYLVIDKIGTQIDELEELVITDPNKETLQYIQSLKSELIYARRLILPIREVVGIIIKLDHIVISDATLVFARSIYDHLNQIIDSVELYREMLTGFLEIYLSSISNKTNDVMKVLTIITSVFIPLSFLAGVYGMNFEYMPELQSRIAYPLLWLVFIGVASGMLYYFRKIGWLSMD